MKLSDSDINHLRRLLAWMRCEVGQSPEELVATVQSILPVVGDPSSDAKERLVRAHTQAQNVPKYVRAAIKALEKALAQQRPTGKTVDGDPSTSMVPHER